jgi:uncharacterized membrane protein YedE/YeeE
VLLTLLVAFGGGLLIGVSATLFLLLNGRIAGISNIVAGLWSANSGDRRWRLFFILGLLGGGATLLDFHPVSLAETPSQPLPVLIAAGLLVGLGARIANGCTSGHGVCGLSRRSARSLAATVTFMLTAMVTVYVVRHL